MCRSSDANAAGKQLPNTACDGSPSPCEKKKIAKCVVHFRPKKGWQGEDFGFDWMRNTDTGTPGDVKYEAKTLGKHYSDVACKVPIADINSFSDNFREDDKMLDRLKNSEYAARNIDWKKSKDKTGATVCEKCYSAWLSLYPKQVRKKDKAGKEQLVNSGYTTNTKATLSMHVEIEEAPDLLRFEDNRFLTISPKEFNTKGTGKGMHKLDDVLTIECNEEFSSDQTIRLNAVVVNADKTETVTLAGLLKVWANGKSRRKTKKVVLIKVVTNTTGVKGNKVAGSTAGQKVLFSNYLKQALINVEVVEEILDLSHDKTLQPKGRYVSGGQIAAYYEEPANTPPGFTVLQDYLFKKLKAKLKAADPKHANKYDTAFRAYYLGENGGYVDASNTVHGLNGYSSGNSVVLFPSKNDQTAAHEFLHSFNLPHSFTNAEADKNAKFTYYRKATNNILDYSHQNSPPTVRNCIWHWQWEIANAAADPEDVPSTEPPHA